VTLARGDADFAGAVVGLGALGITTAVTFDVVPAFQLHDVTTRASFAAALAGLDAALAASDHYKLWWLPPSDDVIVYDRRRTDRRSDDSRLRRFVKDRVVSVAMYRALVAAGRASGRRWIPGINRFLTREAGRPLERVVPSTIGFLTPVPPVHREGEWAFAAADAARLLPAYRELLLGGGHTYNFIQELRWSAADDLWLSPAYQRDTIWLSLYNIDPAGLAGAARAHGRLRARARRPAALGQGGALRSRLPAPAVRAARRLRRAGRALRSRAQVPQPVARRWCCERWPWLLTIRPVGRCRSCTALSVFCRCWPPAPVARHAVHSRSAAGSSSAVAAGSGRTATVIVLECTRPRFSVGGTRCQRWPPASSWNSPASGPNARNTIRPARASHSSRSKSPPGGEPLVDGELLRDQQLGVGAPFGGADLDDDGGMAHDTLLGRAAPSAHGGVDGGRRARLETKDGRDEAVEQDRRQVFRSGEEAMRTTRHE
jgi:hypothetical protein